LKPITNDLMRFAVEALDEQLGEMLASEIAVAEDLQFIRGDGTQNTPRGLKSFASMAPSTSGAGAVNIIASAGSTPAEIVLDLQAAIYALLAASVGMIKPAWIMSPATSTYLQTLQNSDGLFIFKEMSLKGTFLRYPFFETIQIPTNLTVGSNSNCTEIYLFDAAEAMILEGPESEIMTATSADFVDANSVFHAGFAEDTSVIRVVCGRDFVLRHAAAAAVIVGVSYYLGA
jgi:HK97 family phage major capsid protein